MGRGEKRRLKKINKNSSQGLTRPETVKDSNRENLNIFKFQFSLCAAENGNIMSPVCVLCI